jgi:hypothetical protein
MGYKCDDRQCPICYPNWQEEEARRRADEDRQACVNCWRDLQKEAERIVASPDPIARNRRINAAYAQLWLDDKRFQWAGLAAFASKQVGCGLLNAADMIRKSNHQRDAYQRWDQQASFLERMSPYSSPRMPVPDQVMGEGAARVYQMLALGNAALFLEIWPLHKFYKTFGLERFKHCYPYRKKLTGEVYWPLQGKIEFGTVWPEVIEAFSLIDRGDINNGVAMMARHEQLNILQEAIYQDPMFTTLMRGNQFAWALHFRTGSAKEVQLVLANQCTTTGWSSVQFSKDPLANLADSVQRMKFVMMAAQQFDVLLHSRLHGVDVENSIWLIANPR